MKELAKTYSPIDMEDRIYKKWLDNDCFKTKIDKNKKPFTIIMPPPNITGQLHMGHALDNTMQDILIRYKRMKGYNTLWQPGLDHAAIATEVKVTEVLKEAGIDKTELGREGFLKRAWEWKEEYGNRILFQLHKLGCSADWSRTRFTMDEGVSSAVKKVFVDLYEKGLIYKGSKIINWCPVCKTSISDAEVEYKEMESSLWYIKYPVVNEDGNYVIVATSRPETILGDTAVAVNPKDDRYSALIGKKLKLPLTDREIPVIADEYVDLEFGTGCVKITPAHDPNDFEVGLRHDLEQINVLTDTAFMNENAGAFEGLSALEARKRIVEQLKEQGLLEKIEKLIHNVGTHDRCKATIEPMIKPQWFVKMQPLTKPCIEAEKNKELNLVPHSISKQYHHWLDNMRDWCISRQLWWGHRIPAYYCNDCGEIHVRADKQPDNCDKCGCMAFTEDEDTLDTWFSSALWPFSTLGWPNDTEEMKYFYPTDVLVTGYDILFFWVIRMIFSAFEHTNKLPFHTVLFHGLVRDSEGRKMSKSLGNGIDPLQIIEQYGADALRLTLVTGNAPGNDMRFHISRIEASGHFANKVWNASRFILMNLEGKDVPDELDISELQLSDKYIWAKLNRLICDMDINMEKYEMGIAVQKVYDFIWDEFCDWYIEMVKPRLYNETDNTKIAALWTLKNVLSEALKLLHPFMPFITDEIYCSLHHQEMTIMNKAWPEYNKAFDFQKEADITDSIKEAVRRMREVRTDMNVPLSKKTTVYVVSDNEDLRKGFEKGQEFFKSLGKAENLHIQTDKSGIAEDAVSIALSDCFIYLPLDELVDRQKEIDRLNAQKSKLEKEIKRSEGMLNNEKFISKAAKSKIEEEKAKYENYKKELNAVTESLENVSAHSCSK